MPTLDEHIRFVFGGDAGRAFVTGFPQDPSGDNDSATTARMWAGRLYGEGGRELIRNEHNNYLCVSTFAPDAEGKVRRREHQHQATYAVMIDDVGVKVDSKAANKVAPSFVVRTSKNSSQNWLVLSEPCNDAARVQRLVNGLIEVLGGKDPGMRGVTRYGRLPFGINNKAAYGEPWRVQLEGGYGPKHTVEKIAAAFGIDLSMESAPASRLALRPEGIGELEAAVLAALEAEGCDPQGPIGDRQRYALARCPWAHDHTKGEDGAHYFAPTEANAYNGGFVCWHGHCRGQKVRDLYKHLRAKGHAIPEPKRKLSVDDFVYVAPQNAYLCLLTKELWKAEALNKAVSWPKVKT